MLQGMLLATKQASGVFLLLLTTLAVWSYAGFLLFRNIDPSEGQTRFDNIFESLLTCLHIFASRTFSILALNPYYERSHASAFFFVSLTIGADLLCGSLLIAVGTREYRIFANQVYVRHLKKRRYALVAIFDVLSRDGKLHLSEWLKMCSYIKGRNRLARGAARTLFLAECSVANDTSLNCQQFFRLVALASVNVVIEVNTGRNTIGTIQMGESEEERDTISEKNPILVSEKSQIPMQKTSHKHAAIKVAEAAELRHSSPQTHTDHHASAKKLVIYNTHILSFDESSLEESSTLRHPLMDVGAPRSPASPSPPHPAAAPATAANASSPLHIADQGEDGLEADQPDDHRSSRSSSSAFSEAESVKDGGVIGKVKACASRVQESVRDWYHKKALAIIQFSAPVSFRGKVYVVNLFELYFHLMRFLLAIQLILLTSNKSDQEHRTWKNFGWFLESMFWAEMLVRIGEKRSFRIYIRASTKRMQVFINVASLVFGLLTGYSAEYSSARMTIFLVIQMLRFFRIYRFVESFHIYETMLPVFSYVFFLIFSIIYFFAAFAWNRFCSAMVVANAEDNDDDSSSWVNYFNQLNFTTFPQSVYTLFQVSILGSWSMVMSTAAKVYPVASLLFFYTYRLVMTLSVMPLLFSFIIQIFIIRRDMQEKAAAAQRSEPIDEKGAVPPSASPSKGNSEDADPSGGQAMTSRGSINGDLRPKDSSLGGPDDKVNEFLTKMGLFVKDREGRSSLPLGKSSEFGGSTDGTETDLPPAGVGAPSSAGKSDQSDEQSKKMAAVRRVSQNTRVIKGEEENGTDIRGMQLWSAENMLKKPQAVVEKENAELKELLATAVALLREQKSEADALKRDQAKMTKLLDSGLMSRPAKLSEDDRMA
jgi:hypothetical protein